MLTPSDGSYHSAIEMLIMDALRRLPPPSKFPPSERSIAGILFRNCVALAPNLAKSMEAARGKLGGFTGYTPTDVVSYRTKQLNKGKYQYQQRNLFGYADTRVVGYWNFQRTGRPDATSKHLRGIYFFSEPVHCPEDRELMAASAAEW